MTAIPDGFVPLFRTSPLLEVLGPFYQRTEGDNLIVALRIAERHTNARQTVHGGVLATLADIALGYNASFLGVEKTAGAIPTAPMTTASLSIDFAGNARPGDWVEARVDIQKIGQNLAFANAYLCVGQERIARASAVFAVASRDAATHGKAEQTDSSR